MTCTYATNAAAMRLDLCLFDGDHPFRSERLGGGLDRLLAGG